LALFAPHLTTLPDVFKAPEESKRPVPEKRAPAEEVGIEEPPPTKGK
jgi:hypothetical protein